jgi:hypothetical protein
MIEKRGGGGGGGEERERERERERIVKIRIDCKMHCFFISSIPSPVGFIHSFSSRKEGCVDRNVPFLELGLELSTHFSKLHVSRMPGHSPSQSLDDILVLEVPMMAVRCSCQFND